MKHKQSLAKAATRTAALFLAPGIVGFVLFFIAPFCASLYYAFLSKPIGGTFVGFSNFAALFSNRAYLRGLFNTLRFIGLSVPLNIGLSLGIALLINQLPKERRDLCSLFFLVPLVIPSGSLVFFWKTFFAYDGALNSMLHAFDVDKVNWLDSSLALLVMTLIFIWKNLGYNMVLYLAGLGNIPKDYYEAAGMDGAAFHQSFIHITLPCLMPTSALALIMSIVNSFKVFREIYLITGTYPHKSIYTLQHFMNNQFASLNYPRLSSATTILVLIIALFTQALLRLERKAAIGL